MIISLKNTRDRAHGSLKLGILAESQVILAGPSNAGLADPGHGAALSLSRVTAALVGLQQPPTLDNNVSLLMIVPCQQGEASATTMVLGVR
jgi:hypothetical protein